MGRRPPWILIFTVMTAVAWHLHAQERVVPVADVEWKSFQAPCRKLRAALDDVKGPLPAKSVAAIDRLLEAPAQDPDRRAIGIQELLDPYCLVVVTINPESRVKAVRGPTAAELNVGRESICLVKVINEAGVTHMLRLSGPQVRDKTHAGADRWLEAAARARPPLSATLSGQRVEYLLFGLTAREMGKREASLQFDVGQGTQDLGFRAEVPILFTVRRSRP